MPPSSPAPPSEHAAQARKAPPGPIPSALYFIATPIGSARDITLRALDLLAEADVLMAEDTRSLRHLMSIHAIPLRGRPLIACHDHNEARTAPKVIEALQAQKTLVYASEAGTPLVSDPGFALARAAIEGGFAVHAAPGASAVLCALSVSGLPSDRFMFAGFPPHAKGARQEFLRALARIDATVILFESPKRISETLTESAQTFGKERQAALCRELTKRFEEVYRGSLGDLAQEYAARQAKGEIVLLIDRNRAAPTETKAVAEALREAMSKMTTKDAADLVAKAFSLPRREVYKMALQEGDKMQKVQSP